MPRRCKPRKETPPGQRTHSSLTPLKLLDKVTKLEPSTSPRGWDGGKHRGPLLSPEAEPWVVLKMAPGATVPEQSSPVTSYPWASGRDAPPPRMSSSLLVSTRPSCPSPSECDLLRPPSPTRSLWSRVRHGVWPDPGKSSLILHPKNVLVHQK